MKFSISLLALPVLVLAGVASAADDAEKLTFDDHVLAVFRQRCGSCHNPEKKAGGLDVTTYGGLMAGGGSGAVFEAGDAGASYLYQLITHASEPKMPPDSPRIPDSEANLVKRWIDGGLLENKGSKAVAAKKKPMLAAMEAAPTQRPAVTPLPARLPLEPVVRTATDGACCSIATSPWAPLAAVCGQKQILLWRTDTRQLAGVLPFPEGRPHVVVFSRSGSLVLAGGGRGGAAGRVVAWNVEDGRRVLQVGDELDTVLAADISADHALVALGGPQKVVRIHSAASGEKLHDLRKHTDWITAVSFSPDGLLLATADRSGGVVVWEAATGRDFLVLTGHTGGVNAISWRGDSNMLATGSDDGTIRLWEMENGAQVKSWNAHGGGVAAVEFSRDGRIASVGRDRTPKLWAQDGNQQKAFEATPEIGLTVSFCDETDSVVVGDWAGTIRVMKAADAALLGTLSTNPPTLAERLANAEKAAGDAASAVDPVTAEATAATGKLAAKQKDFDTLVTARTAAMTQFEERRKQAETAAAARMAAEAARDAAAAQAKQAADAVAAAVEAHSRAFATLAATPSDASRAGAVAEGTRLREHRDRQAAAAAEAARTTAAQTAAAQTAAAMDAAREQAKAAAEAATAQVAAMEPEVAALKAAAQAAEAKRAEAAGRLEAARAELARWREETGFIARYRELAGAVAAAEDVLRQAEQAAAESQAQVAAAENARRAVDEQRTAARKELEAVTATVAKAEQEHKSLLERMAARQTELSAAQASIDQLTKAAELLGAAATQAQAAAAAAPADAELVSAAKLVGETMAAKATQIKSMKDGMAAKTAERQAWEKEAAEKLAAAGRAKAEMPAITGRIQKLDADDAAAVAAIAEATKAFEAAKAAAAGKQSAVDAAVTALRGHQGIAAR